MIVAVLVLVTAPVRLSAAPDRLPVGLWDATVVVEGLEIPFQFEISGSSSAPRGAFLAGELTVPSTAGSYEDGRLVLRFDQYGAQVDVAVSRDSLDGKYDRGTRGPAYPLTAIRSVPPRRPIEPVPSIGGEWRVLLDKPSALGERSWRLVVRQTIARVSAAIMRVDGDTGTLTGSYRDGRFVLSHFSGARPLLLEVTPAPDGTLLLKQNKQTELVAAREGADTASAFGTPTDPGAHTTVKDAGEVFQFSFPDLDGRIVSNTDARFRGKVLLVNVSGSWCPNCHDEEPFLVALYEKYRDKGLEVVTLSFEEAEQQPEHARLRAFIKTYGITSTVLVPGEPDTASAKLPQAVNLNAFPTSFFVGRDGRVRSTHAGFPSPGSGEYYTKAERDVTAEIEKLLAERVPTTW